MGGEDEEEEECPEFCEVLRRMPPFLLAVELDRVGTGETRMSVEEVLDGAFEEMVVVEGLSTMVISWASMLSA